MYHYSCCTFLEIEDQLLCTIASKINITSKGVRSSEKLELTAALCNEI